MTLIKSKVTLVLLALAVAAVALAAGYQLGVGSDPRDGLKLRSQQGIELLERKKNTPPKACYHEPPNRQGRPAEKNPNCPQNNS